MKVTLPFRNLLRAATRRRFPAGRPVAMVPGADMSAHSRHGGQRGIALIVTLIMLSVITFLTVTFLVLSQRETGSVTTSTDQMISKQAADTATERAKIELLGPMLAHVNPQVYDLMVSTNFINPRGFFPGLSGPGVDSFTNVNYEYRNTGDALTENDRLRVLTNLLYNPRPPVFVTNRNTGRMEFRYYLDLNRNGFFDTNGFIPEIGVNGLPVVNGGVTKYGWYVGDPEWIGILERPDQPHSSSNRFIGRYAYIVVPAGKTLDVNYVHNQAFTRTLTSNNDGFYRNQGIAPWEINLGAFFHDLNPRTYAWGPNYQYNRVDPISPSANVGLGFEDAWAILNYRYNGSYANLASANNLFPSGPFGVDRFLADGIDEYSDGPLTTNRLFEPSEAVGAPWVGADNPNHLFTIQDYFDQSKIATPTPLVLADRLLRAGAETNSFDRYTYYRMLAQLGSDSEPDLRMNINYANVDANMRVIPGAETNLLNWTPLQFFTNAAERLLREQFPNTGISVTNIPVFAFNRIVYSQDVHRLLQLAANMYEATTNTLYPSIFRPYFERVDTNVYIRGFTQVITPTFASPEVTSVPIDIYEGLSTLPESTLLFRNIYGVPWIIGARKGLPNVNEVSAQTLLSLTRKIQVEKPDRLSQERNKFIFRQQLGMDVSFAVGVEAWNSYRSNFVQGGIVRVSGFISCALTNSQGYRTNVIIPYNPPDLVKTPEWKGYGPDKWPRELPDPESFVVPIRTNFLIAGGIYSQNAGQFIRDTNAFEVIPTIPVRWGFSATNHVRVMISDLSGNMFDYVQLHGPVFHRDLSAEIQREDSGFHRLWTTNLVAGDVVLPEGIQNQLSISLGMLPSTVNEWKDFGLGPPQNQSKDTEIAKFKAFYYSQDQVTPIRAPNPAGRFAQAPFTPARTISQLYSWQANDPLVHYVAEDLLDIANFVPSREVYPPLTVVNTTNFLPNIGRLNDRYNPWGGRPQKAAGSPYAYDSGYKDPLVRGSDDWDFPTYKFPNLGWLGRVHRGTPWQTVYLKSRDVIAPLQNQAEYNQRIQRWKEWVGNENLAVATNTAPIKDRMIFNLFTTIPHPNAGRGRLSINQENLAAWSAVLSGVVVRTNDNIGGVAVIQPAVVSPEVQRIVEGINRTKSNTNQFAGQLFPNHQFQTLGDIFATPELTDASFFLPTTNMANAEVWGISDAVVESIPQQILSLLGLSKPRFVIYAYGQALRPAPNSIIRGIGGFSGLCTNYQIVAESATRTVLRVEGSLDPRNRTNSLPEMRYPPRFVVEQFNILPPD